jgi:hypothetical protein
MDDCQFEQHQKIEKKKHCWVSAFFFNWPKFRQKEKLEKKKKEKDVILRVFNNQTSEK